MTLKGSVLVPQRVLLGVSEVDACRCSTVVVTGDDCFSYDDHVVSCSHDHSTINRNQFNLNSSEIQTATPSSTTLTRLCTVVEIIPPPLTAVSELTAADTAVLS